MLATNRYSLRSATSVLPVLLLAACGGGGSSSTPPVSTTATVGGTVSGLTGTVVLQNNGGDDLSISANGTFTFHTPVNKQSNYAVTIHQQPLGPTCQIANGSGTAMADIANVTVTCTTDPATVYIPLRAQATSSPTDATNALFVVSSKAPTAAPVQVATGSINLLGAARPYTIDNSGTPSAGTPTTLVYTTVNSTGENHVWSLNIAANSSLTPTQLTTLNIPYSTTGSLGGVAIPSPYCTSSFIAKDLTDPSSAFVILGLPPDMGNCTATNSLEWYLIHVTDGASAQPTLLQHLTSYNLQGIGATRASDLAPFLPLYSTAGKMTGIVAVDDQGNLNLYPDETFTNPTLLLADVATFGITQALPVLAGATGSSASAQPGYAYLSVLRKSTNVASIYRVDSTGAFSADLFDYTDAISFISNDAKVDSGNLYFTHTDTASLQSVLKIASGDAAPAQVLYASPATASNPGKFLGVSGSHLVFESTRFTANTSAVIGSTLSTLPVAASATPTQIATYTEGSTVFLAGGDLFVTLTTSTRILDITGAELQPDLPNSGFLSSFAPVIQVKNFTGAYLGGGEVYSLDLSQPATPVATRLTSVTGDAYTLPATMNTTGVASFTPTVGYGLNAGGALVYDLGKHDIATVTIPNKSTY
jgi:hypothetical protein